MTNATIILENSLQLMEEGKLAGSGVWVTMVTDDGEKKVELPEEIHTFNGWKSRGFRVKKGEKSEIKFAIWKHTVKEKKPEEKIGNELADGPEERMFLKVSEFFTAAQVEKI